MLRQLAAVVVAPIRAFPVVYIESSDVVNRSTGHWCRRSFAASVSPNPSKQQIVHQKVSKAERRAKVEAFVDRYRASNGGKFPNITHAQQEVGGSYYFIRQIIQELEYNHKVALKTIKGTRLGEVEKVIYPNLDVKLLSKAGNSIVENVPLGGQTVPDTQIDVEILENDPLRLSTQGREVADHDSSKSQADPSISVDVETKVDISKSVELGTRSKENVINGGTGFAEEPTRHLTEEIIHSSKQIEGVTGQTVHDILGLSTEEREVTDHAPTKSQAAPSVSVDVQSKLDILHVPPLDTQGGRQDVVSTVMEQEPIGSKKRDEQRRTEEFSMTEKIASEKPEPLEEGSSLQQRSSIWGNLKSLADGIISFWKKM
ncbi:uncharacterized protein M6B38_186020 [Iris pallida]|uniref:AT3G52170-like helix-turn-helix domain-containing protein n=1 Tax=Iris pallida TaxID=29817 RepID=A0AAX6EIK1_IRIPA|nr:uncharacterized protein M6B38_186020 [Iris pallida]